MDKKDIYEHLANIYLDASQKRKKKGKKRFSLPTAVIVSAGVFVFSVVGILFYSSFSKTNRQKSEFALVLQSDIAKINFNFDPAKKELFTLDLKKLNISHYKYLGFAVKKNSITDTITLRVEFTSTYKEKSEMYVKDIPGTWQEFKIALADFKKISDWSQMENLAFIVEEWNTKENNGVVFLENIRLSR